ncbi:MAG TPA: molecular chaperone TorD family protein [Burkholderiales bacterium]|nr:molecular chaperone TorD family protein [Burkholderiales bacterium]
MSDAVPMQFALTLPPEEVARANFYGLLARLFYAPPDANLLQAIASAGDEFDTDDGEEGIGAAWQALSRACAEADPEAVREEFETAFIGTGKAPVTLYTSAYTIRYSNEAPLADLRGELRALGLGRRDEVSEPEDHIAALCEVMRHLVAEQKRDLEEQKRFFEKWLLPAVEPLCAAIRDSDATAFYKTVGHFANRFFLIEHSAFEML